MNEILFSDVFIDLVHEVADPEKRASLQCLVETVLGSWSLTALQTWASRVGELGKVLEEPVEKFIRFAKCIGYLLDINAPGDINPATVKDVTLITSSKHTDSFLKVLRSLLTLPEPDAPDQNKVKAQSREFWVASVNDLIKTAGTHDQCQEQANTFLGQLQSELVGHGEDGDLVHPIPLFPGCANVLQPCLEALPKLKAGSRKGSMATLTQAIKDRVMQLAVAFLAAENPNISSKDLSIVLDTLKHFGTEPAFPEVHTRLVEWATKHNAAMSTADLIKVMDDYMGNVTAQTYPEVIPIDASEWKKVLSKVQGPLPKDAREKLQILLPELIVRIFLQATGGM